MLELFKDFFDSFLSFFALGHLRSESLLSESSWLTVDFAKAVFGRELLDVVLVVVVEFDLWVLLELFHLLLDLGDLLEALVLACLDHLVDFIHLSLVPFDFRLVVVATLLKENARLEHVVIGFDKHVRLKDG